MFDKNIENQYFTEPKPIEIVRFKPNSNLVFTCQISSAVISHFVFYMFFYCRISAVEPNKRAT